MTVEAKPVKPERPLLQGIERQVRGLTVELQEFLALRWELARLEIESDLTAAKRLALAASTAAVIGLTGLPLLATSAADLLDGRLGLSRTGWLALLGVALLAIAGLIGWGAWRRFCRQRLGLKETLEELREDLLWLQDWSRSDPDEIAKNRD